MGGNKSNTMIFAPKVGVDEEFGHHLANHETKTCVTIASWEENKHAETSQQFGFDPHDTEHLDESSRAVGGIGSKTQAFKSLTVHHKTFGVAVLHSSRVSMVALDPRRIQSNRGKKFVQHRGWAQVHRQWAAGVRSSSSQKSHGG